MADNKKEVEDKKVAFTFFLIPTIMVIIGYFIFPIPYPPSPTDIILAQIILFLGLSLLGIGFLLNKKDIGKKIKIAGWLIFAFFWAKMINFLYVSEDNDIFNAAICIIGIYVLIYLAYHEWLSIKRNEDISCLNWIAGASAISGIIYFGIEQSAIAPWLIGRTAEQSGYLLNLIMGDTQVYGTTIWYHGQYVVTIIFACTALQAMVIFIGMIGTLSKVSLKRKLIGLAITLIPIYILNLLRNAMVAFLLGENITDFYIAHNVLAKIGALMTLIVLLLIVVKIIPEILDNIMSLADLPKRNGPLEKILKKIIKGSK